MRIREPSSPRGEGGWEGVARHRGPASMLALALALAAAAAYLAGPPAWRLVTLGGDLPFYLAALPIAFHVLGPRFGAGLVASLALSVATVDLLKDALDTPRPPRELWLAEAYGPGFPSGHAASAASFWGFIALAKPGLAQLILAIGVPGLVAASRVALNVHYPIDVAGGLALGYCVAALSWLAVNRGVNPAVMLASVSAYSAAVEVATLSRFEVPAAPLGAAVGVWLHFRLAGDRPLGLKAGLLGALLAIAVGSPAAVSDNATLEFVSVMAAASLAVAAPALAATLKRGGQKLM